MTRPAGPAASVNQELARQSGVQEVVVHTVLVFEGGRQKIRVYWATGPHGSRHADVAYNWEADDKHADAIHRVFGFNATVITEESPGFERRKHVVRWRVDS